MAFTNVTTVRKHLSEFKRTLKSVENLTLRLSGEEKLDLPHKGIKPSSEKVKGREQNQPFFETVTLGDGAVSLSHSELVIDSVVAARDQSLTQVYQENIDYRVDHSLGTITRIADGAIESGQKTAVWYYYFKLYSGGVDYVIDYGGGNISRVPDGDLEEGQVVWIDYAVETGEFSDDVVARAIEEAHADLMEQVDEKYADSADDLLEVAETYLALEILSRMKGLEVLQSEFIDPTNKNSISADYLNLGRSYGEQAERLLEPYLKEKSSLAFPRIARNNPGN
jgi:hypothetical protein